MNLDDPTYFAPTSWKARLDAYLAQNVPPFVGANRRAITRSLQDPETGLRMVVNIPADALLGFLREGRYLNAYDRPVVGGVPRNPSQTRRDVDSWLELDHPPQYYFGAVAVGGTGVRFYGEYCMVLKPETVSGDTRVFDRNSYDLTRPPFADEADKKQIAEVLRGTWNGDLVDMLVRKLLPEIRDRQWLVTLGTISDAVLHDEEFVEVHKKGWFTPRDIEEVRQSPEDEALHSHILAKYEDGQAPAIEEMLWVTRRNHVRQKLAANKIAGRVVVSSGRGNRWR